MIEQIVEWIGPALGLAVGAAGVAVIRTRTNSHRISTLEQWKEELVALQLPSCVAALSQQVKDRELASRDAFERNDRDHEEIKRLLEAARLDLIQEFRSSNGRAGR